jgi:hypothetical protein
MPTQTFRSKVDWFYVAIPIAITVRVLWPVPAHLRAGGAIPWTNLLFPIGLIAFFWFLARSIRYDVTDEALVVHQLFSRGIIPLASIYKLRATRTLLAAPALSLDRIEVLASKGPYAVVSPLDKAGFVRAIQARVPALQLEGLAAITDDRRAPDPQSP